LELDEHLDRDFTIFEAAPQVCVRDFTIFEAAPQVCIIHYTNVIVCHTVKVFYIFLYTELAGQRAQVDSYVEHYIKQAVL
jgi:hypothetical protein